MPSAAASSVIRAGGSLRMVTPGFDSHARAFPPASCAATARRAPSFVRTLWLATDRGRGGVGTSSSSSLRARRRLAAPSFQTPSADAAHRIPVYNMGTMKATAAMASGRVTSA